MKKQLKCYLVPCDENKNQPHALRDKSVKLLLILAVAIELVILVIISPVLPAKLNYISAVLPGVLISSTNQSRSALVMSELKENPLLTQAAQLKANDMAEKSYFAHNTPDGKEPWYFFQLAGYQYDAAGENLAVNFVDSNDVHEAWMKSPTHRANILQPKFTEVGIATAKGQYKGRNVIFVAQYFGKPKYTTPPIVAKTISTQVVTSEPKEDIVKKEIVMNEEFTQEPEVQGVEIGVEEFTEKPTVLENIIASPKNNLSKVLWTILTLMIITLLSSFFINIRVQHKDILKKGLLMLIIIVSFIYTNYQIIEYLGDIVGIS